MTNGVRARVVPAGVGSIWAGPPSASLTILYDDLCGFCVRCAEWLASQACLIPVELVGVNSQDAHRRFGHVSLGEDLVVVDDAGRVWSGPDAFLVCLWATARFRSLAYSLSQPGMAGAARRFFDTVSRNRGRLGRISGASDSCGQCDTSTARF